MKGHSGGGGFGVSVGVKAGATTSSSSNFAQTSSSDKSRMHVSYMVSQLVNLKLHTFLITVRTN